MVKQIEGVKAGMSQIFDESGRVMPVTLVRLKSWPTDQKLPLSVTITGRSKGKGFAGVMKRWGFAGGPATHGQSDRARAPGSIGATTTPGRVLKGKKMAGRMGGEKVTVKGLKVLEFDGSSGLAKISGAIPGPAKSKVVLRYGS